MEVREKEILKGSDRLFRKKGFKQVTMDDIARDLGMSKKTVYKYFKNKRDLILQNMRAKIELEKVEFGALENHSRDAVEEMINLIQHVIRMFEESKPSLMEELKRFYPGSWRLMDGFIQSHVYQRIYNNIERGKKEAFYRQDLDSDFLAKMYVSQVRSIMIEDWFPESKYDKSQLFKKLIEYHIRGIASETGNRLFDEYSKSKIRF